MDDIISKRKKKIVSWVGLLLIVVSLVFIVQRFLEVELDYAVFTSPRVVAGLAAVVVAKSLVVLFTATNYGYWLFNVTGMIIPLPEIFKVYCSANLYKYIPGGFLTILGRNKLAVDYEELGHGRVATATVLEGAFFVIAAIIIAMLYSFDYAINELKQIDTLPMASAIVAGIVAVIALVTYLMRHRIKRFLERIGVVGVLNPLVLTKRMGVALVLTNLWGAAFVFILVLLDQPMTTSTALTVIGLFNLSWLVGFFVPIAPAGFGIREAAVLMFIGSIVNDDFLFLAIMSHRVVSILGDVGAYCIAVIYANIKRV